MSEAYGDVFMIYLYDETDSPIGILYRESSYEENTFDEYYFTKNLQGDIIGIYNESGNLVAEYFYDAWGELHTYIDYPGSEHIAEANPFRYRGYYYDQETGFYYLNSRYYDPQVKRFISADSIDIIGATPDGLTDKNLYAYCDNNPVMRTDNGGEFWHLVIGGVIGGIIGGVSAALSGGDAFDIIVGATAGIASGVLTASGVGVVGQVIGSATISMASNAVGQIENIITDSTKETKFDVGDMLFDGVVSAVTANWGGNGASHGNTAGINSSWKRLFNKGLSNSNARKYFYKTAHNSGKEFVLSSLGISSAKNTIGSLVIAGKNKLKSVVGW